ncbi:Oidioi.mRNA.OKI2018_I69.XSR.g16384.t1.cds [Oikopleura dioica]|uniref:Oidioi.mRNA.OKI2018_I69.XSR.g16384.t1.cds n=1 Tax=Oikopleura dioica TaxID=34765 RepID=A0ABN7SFX4_OIKDI|nr:Oidioi.mRNA.OKI2018_I69.XSR.g16384.t1.cds [Oikopleura dioica]
MFRAGRHVVRIRQSHSQRNYSWNPLSWFKSGQSGSAVSGADVVSPSPVAPPQAPPSVVPSPTIEVTTQTPETIVHGLAPETLAPGEPAATNIFEVVNPEPEMLATMIDGWDYFSTLGCINPITYMTLGLDYILPFGEASPLVAIFAVCVPIRMAASFVNLKSTAEIVQAMTMSRLREAIFKSTQGMAENSASNINVLHQGDRGSTSRMNVLPLQRVVEFNKYMKGFGVDLLEEGMERNYYKKMILSKAPTMASFFLISLFLREARILPLECFQTPFLYWDNLSSFTASSVPISAACFGSAFLMANIYQSAAMSRYQTIKIPLNKQLTNYAKSFILPAGVMYGLMWAIDMPNILQAIFIATTFGNQALNAMVKTNLSMKQFFNYKTQEELIMDIQDYVRQNDKYRELLDQRRANQNLLQAHYGWTTTKVSEDDNLSLVEKLQAKKQKFQENSLEMGKVKAAYEALSGKDFESAGREYLQNIYPYYIHEEKEDAASDGIYDKMIENERNIWMEEINRNKSTFQEMDFELFDDGINDSKKSELPVDQIEDDFKSFYRPRKEESDLRPWWERQTA